MTRRAAVIGWPISHSKSPAMMNAAFRAVGLDAEMVPLAIPPGELAPAVAELRAQPMLGASVTIPHKVDAYQLCDRVDAAARATGAVNCLALEGERLVGHNTDAAGFTDALRDAGFALRGTRVVVLGAGGAARAIAYAVAAEGARIDVISRSPADWIQTQPFDTVGTAFAEADLVVDCTPTGLDSSLESAFVDALPLAELPKRAWIATLIYNRATLLLDRARDRGHAVIDGRAMLVHQGARAFALWTGTDAPIAEMRRALDQSLAS